MKKKLISALLCTTMVSAMLAGCGNDAGGAESIESGATTETKTGEEKDTPAHTDGAPTLSLYIPALANFSEQAIAEVESAINEYVADKYDFQVRLDYTEIGNFEQTINLAMTTDQVDVTCYFTDDGQLQTYVKNNQLLDITEYFENASDELKNTFTEAEMKASTIDGKIYGLVRKYQYGGGTKVVMNKNIVEEMGIDAASINSMDGLEKVLYQVKEEHPELTYVMVPQSTKEMLWGFPYDSNIGNTSFAYAEDFDSAELKSLFELDSFREFCDYTHKWYQDGLIMSDAISNTMEGTDLVSAGTAFCCFHNADIDPLETFYANTVETDWIIEPHAVSTSIGNLQYGISANSAHPDESFELLSALYTDAELQTLLAYGIEGEHYVIDENGRADYPEGMDSTNEPYGGFAATAAYPNYLLLPSKAFAVFDDYKSQVNTWNDELKVTSTFGFNFDISEYTDFETAYVNLQDKYRDALLTGSIALDDVLPSIKSELESIGFYEILAEMQSQLDAYMAK